MLAPEPIVGMSSRTLFVYLWQMHKSQTFSLVMLIGMVYVLAIYLNNLLEGWSRGHKITWSLSHQFRSLTPKPKRKLSSLQEIYPSCAG